MAVDTARVLRVSAPVFQEIVKRSGVNWQRLVAVNSRRLPGFPPRCARTSPERTWSVGSARLGHGPSLPRLAHSDGFPFSRSAASRAGRKCRGCARGPTTTAARAAVLISRACSPGESGVASLPAVAAPARMGRARGVWPCPQGGGFGNRRRATAFLAPKDSVGQIPRSAPSSAAGPRNRRAESGFTCLAEAAAPRRNESSRAGVRSVRRGGRGGRACRRDRGDAHGGATHAACGRGRRVGWRALRNAQGLRVVSNVARNALILLDTRRRRGRGEQRG